MPKYYKWKADTTYRSTTTLSYGVIPTDHTGWQSEAPGAQSGAWSYWYRDANVMVGGSYNDANSSRVLVSLSETWNASIDNRNNLTVTLRTTINSIVRDDLRGTNQNTPGRQIDIYRDQSESPILTFTDTQVATAHTIFSGPQTLDDLTFTLAPGESLQRSSLYLHNQVIGMASYDEIWFGVLFLNDLPAEAIPHAVLGANGEWLSHNRPNGDLRIRTSSRWTDNLANTDWGTGYGDPPSVRKENKWLNARVFGKES